MASDHPAPPVRHLVVMGVSGSGKTTLAQALHERLGLPFAEADAFHPASNIAKMSAGTPLTDEDRWPWLRTLRDWMDGHGATGSIITCSALRRSYRDLLAGARGEVLFLHVTVPDDVLRTRLGSREDHFMPPALLDSQLATLEILSPDENGVELINEGSEAELIDAALEWLDARTESRGES